MRPSMRSAPGYRNRRARPGADGVGGLALGRSDDIGNVGHADRAGADGADAGRRDLSAGIDAALAATLAHDADHAQPPGAAGGGDDGRSSGRTARPLPGEVVDHIVAKSDGVPLYVEELTKAILGSGVLEDRGDAYVLKGALAQSAHPGDIAGFADGAARSGAAAA